MLFGKLNGVQQTYRTLGARLRVLAYSATTNENTNITRKTRLPHLLKEKVGSLSGTKITVNSEVDLR